MGWLTPVILGAAVLRDQCFHATGTCQAVFKSGTETCKRRFFSFRPVSHGGLKQVNGASRQTNIIAVYLRP